MTQHPLPRLSLTAIMLAIALLAIVLGTYRYDEWLAFSIVFTCLLLGYTGLIGFAISTQSRLRSFAAGFALAGLAYLLVSISPTHREYLIPGRFFNTAVNYSWTSYPPLTAQAGQVTLRKDIPSWPHIVDAACSLLLAYIVGTAVHSLANRTISAE